MVRTFIVDDTEETRSVLERMVVISGGFVAGTAASAEAALDWLSSHPVDLVLTDYQMPGMRGDELARRIKQLWPSTIVAMTTVLDSEELRRAPGVGWLIAKPVAVGTMRQLLRAVRPVGALRR